MLLLVQQLPLVWSLGEFLRLLKAIMIEGFGSITLD
jgi:hypothetical protein